jgi:excisionase family DNA binding protein
MSSAGYRIFWVNNLAAPSVQKTSKKQGKAMKSIFSDSSPVLTVKDLSIYLRVNQSTIYRLIKGRKLPAFRVGSDWRFNREDIDRWRVEHEAKSRM